MGEGGARWVRGSRGKKCGGCTPHEFVSDQVRKGAS